MVGGRLCGGRPKTLVYSLYKAGTCEKQNECFSVVAKARRKGRRKGNIMCVSICMLSLSSSDEAFVGFPWAAKDRERSAKGTARGWF